MARGACLLQGVLVRMARWLRAAHFAAVPPTWHVLRRAIGNGLVAPHSCSQAIERALLVYEELGWQVAKGFALLEIDGGGFVAQQRWWNVEPASASWVDFTPRRAALSQQVLVESALPAATERHVLA